MKKLLPILPLLVVGLLVSGSLAWPQGAGVPSGGSGGSGTVDNCATANALTAYVSGTEVGCGAADFTYASHTLTAGASGLLDLSAVADSAFKVPAPAADPSVNNGFQYSTNRVCLEIRISGTVYCLAVAAINGNGNTSCETTGQFAGFVSGAGAPHCDSLTAQSSQRTSQKSETGSVDASVLAFTPSAAAGTYRVCFDASVSSATSGVIAWTLSWTDSNGNAQSNVQEPLFQQGTAAPALTFTTSAAGNYWACSTIEVNNAAAAVTAKWVGGGTTAAKVTVTVERVI